MAKSDMIEYLNKRRASLLAEIEAASDGNDWDSRRLADLRSRLSELNRLVQVLSPSPVPSFRKTFG